MRLPCIGLAARFPHRAPGTHESEPPACVPSPLIHYYCDIAGALTRAESPFPSRPVQAWYGMVTTGGARHAPGSLAGPLEPHVSIAAAGQRAPAGDALPHSPRTRLPSRLSARRWHAPYRVAGAREESQKTSRSRRIRVATRTARPVERHGRSPRDITRAPPKTKTYPGLAGPPLEHKP